MVHEYPPIDGALKFVIAIEHETKGQTPDLSLAYQPSISVKFSAQIYQFCYRFNQIGK